MTATNVFEESTLTLRAGISRGKGEDTTKAKFEFELEGGASSLDPVELEVGTGAGEAEVSTKIKLPKCADDEDCYTLSYKVTTDDASYPGKEFKVWPKTGTFKAVDSDGKPLKGVPFNFSHSGETVYVTDKNGECPLPMTETKPATIIVRSPCSVDEWTTEKGRNREAKVTKKEYKVSISEPLLEGNSESAPHKQFVNLKNDDGKTPNQSSKIKVVCGGVTDTECIPGIPGETVHIKVEFHKDNSKRNSPAPSLIAGGATVPANDKGIAEGTVEFDAEGVAQFEVELGLAGGDKTKISVGITDACEDGTVYVQNWRRIWYQLTIPAGESAPNLKRMVDALKEVFIEYLQDGETVEIAEGEDAPTGVSWFDGAWVGKAGSKKLNIGDYNRAHYHTKFVDNHTPWQVHVLCCSTQFDSGKNKTYAGLEATKDSKVKWSDGTNVIGVRKRGGSTLFPKKLNDGASAFIKGSWASDDGSKKGTLAEADVFIDKGYVTAKLPKAATDYLGTDATKKVTVTLTVYRVSGPYLGESDDYKQLIVLDQSSIGVNDTLTHELGHSLNQVPTTAAQKAPGLKTTAHTRAYTGNGHSGGHCANGMSDSNYAGGSGKVGSSYQGDFGSKSECTCVMYGEDNSACTGKFCDICKPFVLADGIQSLH